MHRLLFTAACTLGCLCGPARAQTPLGTAFRYQGELRSGGNLAAGLHDLRFRLFDAAAGGTQLGITLCADDVSLTAGRFSVDLDFGPQFAGQLRFLEIEVRADTGLGCGVATGFTTLTPRQALTPTPNAIFALNAGAAASANNAAQLNGQAASFYQHAGNLNAGTIPDARLAGTYTGVVSLSNPANVFGGSGTGLTGLNASSLASGTLADARLSSNVALLNATQTFFGAKTFSTAPVFSGAGSPFSVVSTALVPNLNADLLDGLDSSAFLQSVPNPLTLSGTTAGHIVRGENASSGTGSSGVHGLATASLGDTTGVFGQSNSPSGIGVQGLGPSSFGTARGVFGQSDANFGIGVNGYASHTTGANYGGWFASNSSAGHGVFGIAGAASGTTYGVFGRSDSSSGRGVYGLAGAADGITIGVHGQSDSVQSLAIGVLGNAASGFGVIGRSMTGSGFIANRAGVWGDSNGTHGVIGTSSASGTGVFGVSTTGLGWGVFASGNLGAFGTKSFCIDHPDDPGNKYLLHYSTESPEVLNAYSGTIVLDGAGEAVVALPHYFAKINTRPRYQLTPVGAPMPLLHVAERISEEALSAGGAAGAGEPAPACSFRIAGGIPGGEVSWEVKAVRNDLWVRRRGAPVEVQKPDLEKGTYQRPELYDQPIGRGIGFEAAHTVAEVERTPRR